MRDETKNDLLSLIPSLRAFAFCLAQDQSRADDLVYSSLVEVSSNHAAKNGLALKVAVFNTVRRRFSQQMIADPVSAPSFGRQRLPPDGEAFGTRFIRLPRTEREAISLIEVWGFDTSQAAEICDCDRETIDRRVGMARCHLAARSSRPISAGAFRADTVAVRASAA